MTLSDVENYLPCIVGSEVVNKTGVWILYSRYNTYQSTEDGQQEDRVTMAIAMRPGKYNELEIRKSFPCKLCSLLQYFASIVSLRKRHSLGFRRSMFVIIC